MSFALNKFTKEDPSLHLEVDPESGQTILKGMGELHLDIIVDRLNREYKVQANVGKPQVAYRETIQSSVEHRYKHVKQTGGSGQYGDVNIVFEPLEPGQGIEFESHIVGGVIPKDFIPSVEHGIREAAKGGILASYEMTDFRAILTDGSYHDVDSSSIAFEQAAKGCFREAMKKAKPVLLEPVMKVIVTTPEEYVGAVIGDFNKRRGLVEGQEPAGNGIEVTAFVPLSEMFGYISDLRNFTSGRATFNMEFNRYSVVPRNVQEEIVAERSS